MKLLDYPKRVWYYIQPPATYEMSCDLCGGSNIYWSEWKGHIWCYDCEADTIGDQGFLDGPVPVNVAAMLGISFEKVWI